MRARALPWWVGLACAGALAATTSHHDALASVSIAVTWDGLLGESTAAAVVTPVDSNSVWENGRIYTYTRVHVARAVAGDLPSGAETWVRTMGGAVGKIGQLVEGEAVFFPGQQSLVFFHAGPAGAFEVTARGQGQFPIVAGDANAPSHVSRSYAVGALVPPHLVASSMGTRIAAEVLHGRLIEDASREVAADWERTHVRLPSSPPAATP
jgi:hypothetical protein